MGLMEEIRARAEAEAQLLPPALVHLKSLEKQTLALLRQMQDAAQSISTLEQSLQAQAVLLERLATLQPQVEQLLAAAQQEDKKLNAIGRLLQAEKEKGKWKMPWIS